MAFTPRINGSPISPTKVMVFIGALFGVFASLFSGFFYIDSRYAHQQELTELKLQHAEELVELNEEITGTLVDVVSMLQLQGNMNYLETDKKILESDVERIEGTLDMYDRKRVDQNGTLSISDQNRVEELSSTLGKKVTQLAAVDSAISTIRMSLTPVSILLD
jgi:hypothetical protein